MSTVPQLSPSAPPTTLGTVDHDRACTRCSYNLRGLPIEGACPECGSSVRDSLRGILLQFASPEYVAALGSGLSMVLVGFLVMVAAALAAPFLYSSGLKPGSAMLAIHLIQVLVSGVIIFGYWRYTEPDPGFVGQEKPDSARQVMRILVCISAGALAVRTGCVWIGTTGATIRGLTEVEQVAYFVYHLAWVIQYFAVMRYTRWMARRVPDPHLIKRAGIYIWLLPALSVLSIASIIIPLMALPISSVTSTPLVGIVIVGGLSALVALILYWNLLDRLRKHVKAIRRTGEPAKLKRMMV